MLKKNKQPFKKLTTKKQRKSHLKVKRSSKLTPLKRRTTSFQRFAKIFALERRRKHKRLRARRQLKRRTWKKYGRNIFRRTRIYRRGRYSLILMAPTVRGARTIARPNSLLKKRFYRRKKVYRAAKRSFYRRVENTFVLAQKHSAFFLDACVASSEGLDGSA